MNIIKHYNQNKIEGMPLLKNISELFFHLHNGKKRIMVGILAIGVNYYFMQQGLTYNEWVFLLSSEYFILKIAESLTNEVSI